MKRTTTTLTLLAFLLALLALPATATSWLYQTSERGVTPTTVAGNFVASDDQQVCYELAYRGLIPGFDAETDMVGIKMDPPVAITSGPVTTSISPDGKLLDWESEAGTEVHAFIIKGGPNFNLFDYTSATGFDWSQAEWDNDLFSPTTTNKKGVVSAPQISHYNLCYTPEPPDGDQGCTPGYWRNHADRWEGVAPGDDFDTTFGVDLFAPDITLGQAIELGGGGNNALARHATAALLNAYGGVPNADGTTVASPYTPAQVIQMVQDAVADDTIEATKDLLAAANELGCPLSGTPANPV